MRRIRATASISTPTSAVVAAVSVGAIKAYTALASLAVASRITVAVASGAAVAAVAYVGAVAVAVEVPRLRAEVYAPAKFIESSTVTDEVEKLIEPVYDSATEGASDAIDYITVIKVLTDSVTTVDALVAFHTKPVDFDITTAAVEPDPATTSDTQAFDLTRPDIADTANATDLAALHPQKVHVDNAHPLESIDFFAVDKVLDDAATTGDGDILFDGVKVLFDSAASSDAPQFHPTLFPIPENVSAIDTVRIATLSAQQDNALTNDEQERTITKVLADSVATQDTADILVIPLREFGDSPTTSDVVNINISAGVDSRTFNGFGLNSTDFN